MKMNTPVLLNVYNTAGTTGRRINDAYSLRLALNQMDRDGIREVQALGHVGGLKCCGRFTVEGLLADLDLVEEIWQDVPGPVVFG